MTNIKTPPISGGGMIGIVITLVMAAAQIAQIIMNEKNKQA